MRPSRSVLSAAVLATALLLPATASAVLCGAEDPATGRPAIGRLTLNGASRTDLVYRRGTAPRAIVLVFDVKGCTLSRTTKPAPQVSMTASTGPGLDLPNAALRKPATAFVDRQQLEYRYDVVTSKLPPGSYNGTIEVRADYLNTVRTPVSVSRSEPLFLIPIAFGALGGLGGIAWYLIASATAVSETTRKRQAVVLVVGIAAGGITGLGFWTNQDVWTIGDNAWATVIAGFTGATTGAVTALAVHRGKDPGSDGSDGGAPVPGLPLDPAPAGNGQQETTPVVSSPV